MTIGVANRTLRSKIEPDSWTTGAVGFCRKVASASFSKRSSWCGARVANGRSETNRYFVVPSRELITRPNSGDIIGGIRIARAP